MNELVTVLLLVLMAFVPAFGYLAWVRRTEHYHEERWILLLKAFAFGAIVSTFFALILELSLSEFYQAALLPEIRQLPKSDTLFGLVLALIIAPVVEEGMKGWGVWRLRSDLRFVADGLVLGAAVGLGFGFLETSLYGVDAFLKGGLAAAVATLFVRAISSTLLHGSATAMTGHGVAENQLHEGRGHLLAGYYFVAVGMHAAFNALIVLPFLLPADWVSYVGTDLLAFLGLVLTVTYALAVFAHVRRRIGELQTQPVAAWNG